MSEEVSSQSNSSLMNSELNVASSTNEAPNLSSELNTNQTISINQDIVSSIDQEHIMNTTTTPTTTEFSANVTNAHILLSDQVSNQKDTDTKNEIENANNNPASNGSHDTINDSTTISSNTECNNDSNVMQSSEINNNPLSNVNANTSEYEKCDLENSTTPDENSSSKMILHKVAVPEGCPPYPISIDFTNISNVDELKTKLEAHVCDVDSKFQEISKDKYSFKCDSLIMADELYNKLIVAFPDMQICYSDGELEKIPGANCENFILGRHSLKLFIGALPRKTQNEDIHRHFIRFGELEDVHAIYDHAKMQMQGTALIVFKYKESGLWAIHCVDGVERFDNYERTLEVKIAGKTKDNSINAKDASATVDPNNVIIKDATVQSQIMPNQQLPTSGPVRNGGDVSSATSPTSPTSNLAQNPYMQQQQTAYGAQQQQQYNAYNPNGVQQMQQPNNASQYGSNAPATNPYNGYGMKPQMNMPPQMSNWQEYHTDDGRPYYYNSQTMQTQWEKPPDFGSQNQIQQPAPIQQQPMQQQPIQQTMPFQQQIAPQYNQPFQQPMPQYNPMMGSAPQSLEGTGPLGANVFVFHVPNDWTQHDLANAFKPFGNVVSSRVAIDKESKRNKGFGFVSYDNVQSAAEAVLRMDGWSAGGKRLKVSIKKGEEQYVQHLLAQPQMGMPQPQMAQPGVVPNMGQLPMQMNPQMGYPPANPNMMQGAPPQAGNYGMQY